MRKFIYAQPEENIVYLINRIAESQEDEIHIAADANPGIFKDALNLKLLKREADELGKKITIASKMAGVISAAANAGFETTPDDFSKEEHGEIAPATGQDQTAGAETLEELEMASDEPEDDLSGVLPWMKKKPRPAEKEENIERYEEKLPQPSRKTSGIFTWKFIGGLIALAVAISAGAFYLLSPSVSINIQPKKTTLNLDLKVTADTAVTAIDVKTSKIPGQLIKMDKESSDSFAAGGRQEGESKAEGEITIYNEFGSVSQRLVKTTRFKAANGIIFRLKSDTVVPGATVSDGKVTAPGIVTAGVIADQPGPEYNIGPSDFTIPGFEGTPKFISFYGKSSKPMTGGALSGKPFAAKEDLDNARSKLIEKFSQSLDESIKSALPDGFKTLPRARTEPAYNFSAELVGEDGKFIAKLKVSYSVFAFSENDLNSLIDQYLSGKLVESQEPIPESRALSYSNEVIGANNLSLAFEVKLNQLTRGKIDEEKIKEEVAGKDEEKIKKVLRSYEAIESADFAFSPRWISVAPTNTDKIKIIVQN